MTALSAQLMLRELKHPSFHTDLNTFREASAIKGKSLRRRYLTLYESLLVQFPPIGVKLERQGDFGGDAFPMPDGFGINRDRADFGR